MNTPPTILIVDDEPTTLAILAEILEPEYRIRVARSGTQAVKAAVTNPRPDLILLDVQMPDMNGYQVMAALRQNPASKGIPVIFVTARSTALDEEQGLRSGAADYITKPPQPSVVRARVHTQLENKAARDLLKQDNVSLMKNLLRAQQLGHIGSWHVDLKTGHLTWSPETYRLFGLELNTPLKIETYFENIYSEDRDRVWAAWQSALAGQPYDIEHRTAQSQGQVWIRAIAEFEGWDQGKPTVAFGTGQDITERKQHQQQLEMLAFRDPLTKLLNRHGFTQTLEQSLQQMKGDLYETCLYQIDLDKLGQINRNLGEQAGDEVLRVISQRLATFAGASDRVARLGGDQFAVVRYDCIGSDCCVAKQVQALQDLITHPINLGNDTVRVTACIGSVRNTGNTVHQAGVLLRMVDQAMYQAKLGGKSNSAQFDLSQYRVEQSRQDKLNEIRHGLQERQFRLYYQPKIDLLTGRLVGLEALIRWQHPERGLVGPGEFIPHLEGHPLMVELGDWVIGAALAQALRWQSSGLKTVVSVNVASNQLEHPEFVTTLADRLTACPSLNVSQQVIEPSLFELEILETGPLLNLEEVAQTFEQLKAVGVTISLDDFGVGHSSLQMLYRLSPHSLKIDRSFVLGMLDDDKSMEIVRAILGLGQIFGLKVVAEGVETPAHGQALIKLGCRYAQGYAIARPMPADQVIDWAAQWQSQMPRWIGLGQICLYEMSGMSEMSRGLSVDP